MALRIKGKGSVLQDVPVTSALGASLLEWKDIQESFRILAPGGIAFAASQFVLAGHSGGAVFQPGLQFATALRLQSPWGGGDHRPWVTAFRGHDPPQSLGKGICEKSRSLSATRISAPRCATPTSAMSRLARRRNHSARLWSESGRHCCSGEPSRGVMRSVKTTRYQIHPHSRQRSDQQPLKDTQGTLTPSK